MTKQKSLYLFGKGIFTLYFFAWNFLFRYLYNGFLTHFFILDCINNRFDITKGNANQYQACIVDDIYQPTVVLVQEGQTILRGTYYVHEVDVGDTIEHNTVYVEGDKHDCE